MIVVEFTFLEALEILYNNNFKNKDENKQLIGIATDEMLKRHCYISFVKEYKNYKNGFLKNIHIHTDRQTTPYSDYTVSVEDFNKKWHLYYTMDALVEAINKVSDIKIE